MLTRLDEDANLMAALNEGSYENIPEVAGRTRDQYHLLRSLK